MKKTKILWISGSILIFINIIFYCCRFGGDSVLLYISDLLPVICSLIASAALFTAYRSFKTFDFTKIAWLLLFIGIFFYFIAESLYAVLEIIYKLDMNENFPSIADIFWYAGYIPVIVALVMLFTGYKKSGFPMGNVKGYLTVTVAFIIAAVAVIYYVLMPIIIDSETGLLVKISSLYYPIADLFVVAPAIILMYITYVLGKGRLSRPWKFIAIAFISFTVSDLFYSYLSWTDQYGSGNFIDVFWHAGYLFMALSALYQVELIESVKAEV